MQFRVFTFLMIVTVVSAAPTKKADKRKENTSASTAVTYTETAPEEVLQRRFAKLKALEEDDDQDIEKQKQETKTEKETETETDKDRQTTSSPREALKEENLPGSAEESSGTLKEKQKTSDSSKEQTKTGMSYPLNLEITQEILNAADCQTDFIELTTQKDGKFEKFIVPICKCRITLQVVSQSSGEVVVTGKHQLEARKEAGTQEEKIVLNYADLVKNLSDEQVKELNKYIDETKKGIKGEETDKGTEGFSLNIKP